MAKFEVEIGGVEAWTATLDSVIEIVKRARGLAAAGHFDRAVADLGVAEGLLLIVKFSAPGGAAVAAKLIARLRGEWATEAEAGDEISYADCDLW